MARSWANSASTRKRARQRLANTQAPCWICGMPIDYTLRTPDPASFELDHKKPVDHYPELAFEASNWAASHRQCNRAKSNREYAPILRRSASVIYPD